jgi:hypothetical protein
MYRGFELNIKDWKIDASYEALGATLYEKYKRDTSSFLEQYLTKNGALDGAKMQEQWFPQVDADIFISHSHADEKLALRLAGWLYSNFKIKCFIDSTIWKYSNKLLKIIDNEHCKNKDGKTYNYDLRNNSTSHVHIMLTTALTKMIDKTECFFFINTDNSITIQNTIEDPITYSPWIYSELEMSRLVRKKELSEYRKLISKTVMFSADEIRMINESVKITHKVDLEHLTKLSKDDFTVWYQLNRTEKLQYPLGHLYNLRPLKELKLAKL